MNDTQARGVKRPAAKGDGEQGKRRVPYAVRACDACRKRKGRCCGRQPCEYCMGRNQPCYFSSHVGEWRAGVTNVEANPESHARPPPSWWSPEALGSLEELVANLQGHITSLEAQVRQNNDGNSAGSAHSLTSSTTVVAQPPTNGISPARNAGSDKAASRLDHASMVAPPDDTATECPEGNKFYGPTSPDFSLNMAQMRLRTGSLSTLDLSNRQLASIDDGQSDDEDPSSGIDQEAEPASRHRVANSPVFEKLLQFRNYFSVREAVRILLVYHEVVGEYHPILDIDMLVKQVKWWYIWPNGQQPPGLSSADEHNILVVNLAMAIALCIESTSPGFEHAELRDKIYLSCRELIDARIAWHSPSTKNVVVMLLVGIFNFYRDALRYAWRMCGLAGRVLMELGLHSQEVAKHLLGTGQQWAEYTVVATSIVVLDRQWSAATGLPTNFSNSDFDLELGSLVKIPYLKGMMSFITISDKFSEPSSRVAKGGKYEDDDQFDIMNFQIEQWRKKAVGSYNFQQVRVGQPPSSFPPAWAILLHLRANAVRGMLLRPFFFSNTSTAASRRNIQPGLDLITETTDMISVLDHTTDIYRRHHPCFQHILTTSCALMFLIVTHVQQNRPSLSTSLSETLAQSVSRNFRNALSLANAYRESSRASRRLWKRLMRMERLLIEAGLLQRLDDLGPDKNQQACSNLYQQPSRGDEIYPTTKSGTTKINDPPLVPTFTDLEHDYPLSGNAESSPDSLFAFGGMNMDWTMPLPEDWGMNVTNGLFGSI